MQSTASSPKADLFFLALKALAGVAEVAIIAGLIYAAFMAVRYWPHITV